MALVARGREEAFWVLTVRSPWVEGKMRVAPVSPSDKLSKGQLLAIIVGSAFAGIIIVVGISLLIVAMVGFIVLLLIVFLDCFWGVFVVVLFLVLCFVFGFFSSCEIATCKVRIVLDCGYKYRAFAC